MQISNPRVPRFSAMEETPGPYNIAKQEALAIFDLAEDIGLVHTVSNWTDGYSFVCNCCGCCCRVLRGITEWGVENSVAQANFYSVIDPDLCLGCGTCIERCQIMAISEIDGVSVVDRKRCIGCGLCVTGCPNGVARLERKPEAEVIVPPMDYFAWQHRRLHASSQ
jgi:electron transport complex protein RnfB